MVVKVYISGISGNKEVKKRQQRVLMILDSKSISYDCLDITEPGKEADKEFMQQNSKARESKHPLPPQIFNEDVYCGDYEDFDIANENDELEKFLKVPETSNNKTLTSSSIENGHVNGNTSSRENSADKESAVSGDQQVPESQESITRQDESPNPVTDNTIQDEEMTTNNFEDEHGRPVKEELQEEKMDEDEKDVEEDSDDIDKDNNEPAGEE